MKTKLLSQLILDKIEGCIPGIASSAIAEEDIIKFSNMLANAKNLHEDEKQNIITKFNEWIEQLSRADKSFHEKIIAKHFQNVIKQL